MTTPFRRSAGLDQRVRPSPCRCRGIRRPASRRGVPVCTIRLRASTTSGLYFPAAGLSTHERPMTQAHAIAAGGAFLSTPVNEDDVFVPEDLTEEQRMFGRTAAEFMHKEVLPVADRLYGTRLGAHAPVAEESERSGPAASRDSAGVRRARARSHQRLVCRRADRREPLVRRVAGAHTSIGTLPLVYFGTDEQKERYLPQLSAGDMIAAYALTEPQSGSDARAARTTATLSPDGRHYLLNGQKMWIAPTAASPICSPSSPRSMATSSPRSWSNDRWASCGRDEIKLGLDGSSTTALMLDDVKVPSRFRRSCRSSCPGHCRTSTRSRGTSCAVPRFHR